MSNTFISSKKSFTAIIAIMIISLTTLAASAVVLANAEQTQEHIDYRFVIYDQNSKSVFEQGLHSGWGVEQAAYKFMGAGNYRAEVTINTYYLHL